jgi:hypothetical protein
MDTYLRIRQSLKRNRRKSLFIGGLIAAVMITSLPTIFYIWDPPEKDCSRSNSIGKASTLNISASSSLYCLVAIMHALLNQEVPCIKDACMDVFEHSFKGSRSSAFRSKHHMTYNLHLTD